MGAACAAQWFRNHQVEIVATEQLVLFIAQDLQAPAIDEFDPVVQVQRDQQDLRHVQVALDPIALGAQRIQRRAPSRHVVDDAYVARGPAVADFADRQEYRELAAVGTRRHHVAADADDAPLARALVAAHVVVVPLAIAARHQHRDVAADDVGRGVAEQDFSAGVERFDASVRIDDDDRIDRGVEQRLQLDVRATHGIGWRVRVTLLVSQVGLPRATSRRARIGRRLARRAARRRVPDLAQ